jgi:hypothetical protein
VTSYDLDYCRRRLVEYGATRGEPGFDEMKLLAMRDGCWRRDGLLRTGLEPGAEQSLREGEPPDLWS